MCTFFAKVQLVTNTRCVPLLHLLVPYTFRMLQNGIIRKRFSPTGKDMTPSCGKLRDEKLGSRYSSRVRDRHGDDCVQFTTVQYFEINYNNT